MFHVQLNAINTQQIELTTPQVPSSGRDYVPSVVVVSCPPLLRKTAEDKGHHRHLRGGHTQNNPRSREWLDREHFQMCAAGSIDRGEIMHFLLYSLLLFHNRKKRQKGPERCRMPGWRTKVKSQRDGQTTTENHPVHDELFTRKSTFSSQNVEGFRGFPLLLDSPNKICIPVWPKDQRPRNAE